MSTSTVARPPATIAHTHTHHPVYSDFLGKAFLTDPVFNYLSHGARWYHKPAAIYHMIRLQLIASAYKSEASFYTASTPPQGSQTLVSEKEAELNPQCCAVVMIPGQPDLLGVGVLGWIKVLMSGFHKSFYYAGVRPLQEYTNSYAAYVKRVKEQVFQKGETFYYIQFIATDEKHRGKGLAQVVIGKVQERAGREMKPIWLEASSAASRSVYRKCGFVDAELEGEEKMRLGAGRFDESGELCEGEGALGVPVFPMVWWPEGYKKEIM